MYNNLLNKKEKVAAEPVYESTAYLGATEVSIPILENVSNLNYGIDFKVGYLPERINPKDKNNPIENMTKFIFGMDGESLE